MQLPENRYRFSAEKEMKLSRKKILVVSAVIVLIGTGAFFLLGGSGYLSAISSHLTKQNSEDIDIYQLWERKEYSYINEICEEKLLENPLDPEYLALNGFAYFYRGTSLYTLEDQIPLYDMAVINLRKALIKEALRNKGQVHYILGKTYYHKGRFYIDLAIRHLEESVALGYESADTYRYLGLAYSELGDYERGVEKFLAAAEGQPDSLLYMTIGQTYFKMKKVDKALDFLMRAVHSTDEETVEKKSRFLIGNIYLEMNEFQKAKDQFEKILSIEADSADAHYYLGEIYDKMGEQVKARAEWRKVLNIDPSHYGALLKLY